MSLIDSPDVLKREEYPEAIVIRVCVRQIIDEEQLIAVRDALYRQAERCSGHLILDLCAVDYLSSASLGWLITLRKRLMQRGRSFQAPCRRRGLFAFYPDAAAALEAVRRGESDPLLLCGVNDAIMEIFQVC